jgi:predicted dehydrogenase
MSTRFRQRVGRRTVLKQGLGLLAAPWILSPRVHAVAPSERVNLGFIGIGMMGRAHLRRMVSNPDVQIVGLCDVDEWRVNDAKSQVETAYTEQKRGGGGTYKGVTAYKDFRELLARPDIDAVLIATGDRWHAVISTMAAKAGKDVYCEKPVSLTIHESRAMVDTVRRYGRVFQGGFQQRSTPDFAIAKQLIQDGKIGPLTHIYCNWFGTSTVVNLPEEAAPSTVDWDMWLGPSPWHPFNSRFHFVGEPKRVVPWDFNRDFAGGSITSNGSHHLDIAQWVMGMDESGPTEIIPAPPGGRIITYKYASGVTVQSFPARLDPKTQFIPTGFDPSMRFQWEILFVGEHGWIVAGREGPLKAYPAEILKDVTVLGTSAPPATPPPATAPAATAPQAPAAAGRGADGRTGATPPRELAEQLYRARGYAHHDNWIQSIRMRQRPISDVEAATRSTNVAHLANIATWTGRTQKWDPIREAFIDDEAANRLRQRAMRAPWTL